MFERIRTVTAMASRRSLRAALLGALLGFAAALPARAQVSVHVGIGYPPPPLVHRQAPVARAGLIWTPGHRVRLGGRYVWVGAGWIAAWPAERWAPARWERRHHGWDDRWERRRGHWVREHPRGPWRDGRR